MEKITVYRFAKFDIESGEMKVSSLYATLDAIKAIEGSVIRENPIEIEASMLDGNGMHKPKTE